MSNSFFYEQHKDAVRIVQGASMNFYAHLHRQVEFCLQMQGTQQMTVDGVTYTLHEGDAVLVLPNRVHSYSALGEGKNILGIIDISAAGEYAPALMGSSCENPFLPASAAHPDIRRCIEALAAGDIQDAALRRAYISVVLGRLIEKIPLTPAAPAAGRDIAHSLLMYITEHIAEPISLEILSHKLFFNKYSISRVFSEQIGCSLHTYVNALRVELAQNLLRDPSVTTSDLIARCGFESERTFYRTFREHCGMTPRQYRQQAVRK